MRCRRKIYKNIRKAGFRKDKQRKNKLNNNFKSNEMQQL